MKEVNKEKEILEDQQFKWKQEQDIVKEKVAKADDILELNVGGITNGFVVRRSLLCSVPGSALEAMFSGRHHLPKFEGKIFVDRNPVVFSHIIDYLRNNMQLPEGLDKLEIGKIDLEIQFWGLKPKQEYHLSQ